MMRVVYGILSLFFGCIFWFAFDAPHPQHEPFSLDYRTLLGLTAWLCVYASGKLGSLALTSKERA